MCGEDYYGDGKHCRACSRPCPEKHYEVQPCARDVKKICKACTQTCRPGYFMAQPCSHSENAVCRVCRPECGAGEFESRQCSTHHDRQCLNMTLLERPETSENLLLEVRGHVTENGTRLDKLPAEYVGFNNYRLERGTGIYLHLTVRFIDATQQFVPVNDTRPLNFDLKYDAPDILNSYSVQRLCRYPLPDYYTLRYVEKEDITYKQHDNGTIGPCDFEGGDSFQSGQSNSFLCAQPGGLTDLFQMDENFFMARSKWVDTSRRCQRKSLDCESCIRTCSTNMAKDNPICEVTGDHSDNGVSPKLWLCYNCCVRKKCDKKCEDYHMNKCQPQQCTKGNLLEFTLEPVWVSSQDGRFFCHIRPRPKQYLLNLDYSIRVGRRSQGEKDGKGRDQGSDRNRGRGWGRSNQAEDLVIRKSTITITGDEDWVKAGAMTYSDGILNIAINSSLGVPPDFLEGDIHPHSSFFKVGDYRTQGSRLGNSFIQSQYVFLRPPVPYGTPVMPRAHQECAMPEMEDMLFTSNMENPYIRRSDLEAHADNRSLPFIIKSKSSLPVVMATVSRDTAILQKIYSPVRLLEESFRGDVVHNGSHWVVDISGETDSCPGYIQIKLSDPAQASVPIFDCDIAVLCPKTFNLTFAMLTSDLEGMYKDVLIQVKDTEHEHNFRLFRRTSLEERQEEEDISKELTSLNSKAAFDAMAEAMRQPRPESDLRGSQAVSVKTPNLPLPMYALLIIAGGVLLLIVLAIIGQCFLADFPIPDTPYAQVHHAFFAVCYMVLQFLYSLFISGTAFFLILTIITHEDVTFIVRHGQPGAVSTAASNIELLRLQRHLEAEITRQDALADAAQEMCIHDVEKISTDMRRLHGAVLNATQDVFERHRLDLLLTKQKLHVRQKLSRDLNKFR
ncbi:hypothetical protein EGW08_008279 [Elysia chlorotica]|uniref:TNFR-Cys domain-containing protein n=1 Tax=Elysia chlorotica TaxID=188477 RepID=A0A433TQR9_ELYCH|nr:hypothetical protein EGW08_008279 [Elysia chlorotica]